MRTDYPTAETEHVLDDVIAERHRQIELWGHNEDTPDGTGPGIRWMRGVGVRASANRIEEAVRAEYDDKVRSGDELTWRDFLLEELAEAFKEDDPDRLYTELTQVAAVAVSWCEKLRAR